MAVDVFGENFKKEYSNSIKLDYKETYLENNYSENELKIFTEKYSKSNIENYVTEI